jgi:Zn-dependent protease with chaperone function
MAIAPINLIGLKADQFRHPLDLEATQALKQLPGLDLLIRNLIGPMAEQFFYLDNISSSVLVGEQQLPNLHHLLLQACQILDLQPPQLYVRQHPAPNAYTLAMRGRQPFIVVHTSLLDLLQPPEIQAVLAHELGHLKCEHGVYLTLANLLVLALAQVPQGGNWLAQGLQLQLLNWVRCAEFSCDRAALLVSQDPMVVASLLMKLAGGSPTLAEQLNVEAFLAQARAYEQTKGEWTEVIKPLQTAQRTHPLPVLRAREIDRWASGQDYQRLLQCHALRYNKKASQGEWRNW